MPIKKKKKTVVDKKPVVTNKKPGKKAEAVNKEKLTSSNKVDNKKYYGEHEKTVTYTLCGCKLRVLSNSADGIIIKVLEGNFPIKEIGLLKDKNKDKVSLFKHIDNEGSSKIYSVTPSKGTEIIEKFPGYSIINVL